MELVRTRAALASAEKEFALLESVVHQDTEFRHRFVSFVGMMQRVGAILDTETKGKRTDAFGTWWSQEKQDATLKALTDIRNAEFKRGEGRKSAHHDIRTYDFAGATDSVSAVVTRDGEVISEGHSPASAPELPKLPEATHEVSWKFVGGALNGQDVMTVLTAYMKTLKAMVEKAEQLL
ncbi:MAG: hypothetical protein M3P53_05140 [Actinomycetota bacterium]|nr:hypothetical protein [Actinomycetota bacterium]